jgi:hypothetical protein
MAWDGELIPFDDDLEPGSTVGRTPWSVPAPFTISSDAARRLGYAPVTDYGASMPQVCQWLSRQSTQGWEQCFHVLAAYQRPLFDYAAEDEFLRARPS